MIGINGRNCQIVYQALKNGADADPSCDANLSPVTVARKIRDCLGIKYANFKTSKEHWDMEKKSDLTREFRCASLNYTLLKMYRRFNVVIERARIMKDWKTVHIRLQNLEVIFNKVEAIWSGSILICEVGNSGNWQQMYSEVVHDWKILDTRPSKTILMHINPSERKSSKKVLIRLKLIQGDCDDMVIACKTVEWRDLVKHGKQHINFNDKPSSAIAKFDINFSFHAENSKIDRLHSQCISDMKGVLLDIKNFNNDSNRGWEGLGTLDVNIQECREPCSTLLHAAVYLSDPGLVMSLINAGAKQICSNHHTPQSLAKELIKEGEALEHKMREEGTWDDSSRMAIRLSERKKILAIFLQYGHTCSNEAETMTLDQQMKTPQKSKHLTPCIVKEPTPSYLWFISSESRSRICHLYRVNQGCYKGSNCSYHHVHEFPGLQGHNASELKHVNTGIRESKIQWKQVITDDHVYLYTAAYYDKADGVYFKSEQGEHVHQSENGLYWYESKKKCFDALHFVMAAYIVNKSGGINHYSNDIHRKEKRQNKDSGANESVESDVFEVMAETEEQPTAKTNPTEARDKLEGSMFHLLLQSDLNEIHEKIFGVAIEDDGWEITERRISYGTKVYHAKLKAPDCIQDKSEFVSSCNFAELDVDGKWYHENQKKAKSSAFMQMMEYGRGDYVSEDMKYAEWTGDELPFCT